MKTAVLESTPHPFAALYGQWLAHAARRFAALRAPRAPIEPRAFNAVRRLAIAAMRQRRQLVRALFGDPSLSVLLWTAEAAWERGDTATAGTLSAELAHRVALALAHAGALPSTGVALEAPPSQLWTLTLGARLRLVQPARRAVYHPHRVEFDFHAGATVSIPLDSLQANEGAQGHVEIDKPFHRVRDGMFLALADDNPLAELETHPDKPDNFLTLGQRPPRAWVDGIGKALDLVGEAHPALRAEMAVAIRQFIPVGFDEQRHLSASYREAVGSIYLTLHPRTLTMAEALVHEFQHNKLNIVSHLDPLLLNPPSARYRSPVRPDPRPLMGVLLAAHAFVPVAAMLLRLLERGAHGEARADLVRHLRRVVERNEEACGILAAHAEPTQAGAALLERLQALHEDTRERAARLT